MADIPMPNQAPVRLRNGSVIQFWQYPDSTQPCPMCGDVGAHWYQLDRYKQDGDYETLPFRWGAMAHELCPVCDAEGALEDYFALRDGEELTGKYVPSGLRLEEGWDVLRYEWLERSFWHSQAVIRLCIGQRTTLEALLDFARHYRALCLEQGVSPRAGYADIIGRTLVALDTVKCDASVFEGVSTDAAVCGKQTQIHVFPNGYVSCVVCGEIFPRWKPDSSNADPQKFIERGGLNQPSQGYDSYLCDMCECYGGEHEYEALLSETPVRPENPDEYFAFYRIVRLLMWGWLPQQLAVLQTGLNLSGDEVREQWLWAIDILRKMPPKALDQFRITDLDRITEAHWQHALHPGSSSTR